MLEVNKIYQGDCLEAMKQIDDRSIDLIINDPPYNINKAKWDKIPNYIEWCGKWLLECQRVLKDNGSLYFFHNDMVQIAQLMEWIRQNTRFVFKQFIVWNKYFQGSKDEGYCKYRLSNNQNRNYYSGFTEYCLFYTFQDETGLSTVMLDVNNFPTMRKYFYDLLCFIGKNNKEIGNKLGHRKAEHCFYWNTTQWDMPTKETYEELIKVFNIDKWEGFREYESLRQEYESLRYVFNNQRVMTDKFNNQKWNNNVWNYEITKKQGHVTPKPIDLIENILQHSSSEGQLVLDCFAGSGTTGVACQNLKRNYILIEKDEKYFQLAKDRLEKNLDGRLF